LGQVIHGLQLKACLFALAHELRCQELYGDIRHRAKSPFGFAKPTIFIGGYSRHKPFSDIGRQVDRDGSAPFVIGHNMGKPTGGIPHRFL
jgi:hypothetical protein